jgi:hypothetical protein
VAITPERIQQIEAAIATLEGQGLKVTNDAVLQLVGGRKAFINEHLKQWRADARREREMPQGREEARPMEQQHGMQLIGWAPVAMPDRPERQTPTAQEVPESSVSVDGLYTRYVEAVEHERALGEAWGGCKRQRDVALSQVPMLQIRRDQAVMQDQDVEVDRLNAAIQRLQIAAAAAERQHQRLGRQRETACASILQAQQAWQQAQAQARRQARAAWFAAETRPA